MNSLFSHHHVPEHLWLPVYRFEPTESFHRRVSRNLPGVERQSDRAPFAVDLSPGLVSGQITSFYVDVFPGRIVQVHVRAAIVLDGIDNIDSLVEIVSPMRSAKTVPAVHDLIKHCLAEGGVSHNANYDSFFALQVSLPRPAKLVDRLIRANLRGFVSLLIGAQSSQRLKKSLVRRVVHASSGLNSKASGELLLLNRQGMLYVRPDDNSSSPHRDRFKQSGELAAIACFIRSFLRDGSGFSNKRGSEALVIVRKIRQLVEYSEVNFDRSFSHTETWKLLTKSFMLRDRLAAWEDYFVQK